MMEASSSKDTNGLLPEELGLEELWSELQSLKKLYGLLHKSSTKTPNGDTGHEYCLDENSRIVLKKLLDGATHQALQSQAKIVCYTPNLPHPPKKSENREPKISISTEKAASNQHKSQRSNPVSAQQCRPESTQSSKVEATDNQPKQEPESEPKLGRKPNANRAEFARQSSRKSTTVSDKKSTHHHHHQHQHPHIHHRYREPSKLKPKNNNAKEKQNQNQNQEPNEQVKQRQSNGELLAIVPAEKRARVDPAGQLGQTSRNQTPVVGRVDRELTHWKRGPRSRPPSRLGSLREERETKSAVAREARQRGPQRRAAGPMGEQTDPRPKKHPPTRRQSIGYSSSTTRADSSASSFSNSSPLRRVVRREGPTRPPPRRMPRQRKKVGQPPPKRPAAEEGNDEGRLKRFKNKLAVIFHHHHHHHLSGAHRGQRSPWAYLMSSVHNRRSGEGKELARRAPAQKQQRGYLQALLDGLIRHVWRMRRRKREGRRSAGRVQGKKLHWWQRFRGRGGVRLASKKAPRLRLGFNRARSRNTRNRKSSDGPVCTLIVDGLIRDCKL